MLQAAINIWLFFVDTCSDLNNFNKTIIMSFNLSFHVACKVLTENAVRIGLRLLMLNFSLIYYWSQRIMIFYRHSFGAIILFSHSSIKRSIYALSCRIYRVFMMCFLAHLFKITYVNILWPRAFLIW